MRNAVQSRCRSFAVVHRTTPHAGRCPMSSGVPVGGLRGRSKECAALDRLLSAASAGRSQVLILRGEAGVGKTALLEYVVQQASGIRIVRVGGVESEVELAFA